MYNSFHNSASLLAYSTNKAGKCKRNIPKKRKNSFYIHIFTALSLFFYIVKVLHSFCYIFITKKFICNKKNKKWNKAFKNTVILTFTSIYLTISTLKTSKKLKKFKKKKTKHFLLLQVYCNINVIKEI